LVALAAARRLPYWLSELGSPHAQIKKVPRNYNWNTKGVQIKKKKKIEKKLGPSPGCADSRTV
jgi:hypothetical protein